MARKLTLTQKWQETASDPNVFKDDPVFEKSGAYLEASITLKNPLGKNITEILDTKRFSQEQLVLEVSVPPAEEGGQPSVIRVYREIGYDQLAQGISVTIHYEATAPWPDDAAKGKVIEDAEKALSQVTKVTGWLDKAENKGAKDEKSREEKPKDDNAGGGRPPNNDFRGRGGRRD